MTNRQISEKIKNEIIEIIQTHTKECCLTEIFLFGSYAQGCARNTSDIDICLKSTHKIDYSILLRIKSALEESNIPYKVDIVDYHHLDDDFKSIAFKDIVKWL